MECRLHSTQDLSGAGVTAMVVGQVQHISVEEDYAQGYGRRYGRDGFMLLVAAPQNLVTGEPGQSALPQCAWKGWIEFYKGLFLYVSVIF